jgi:hypothetical protein
MSVGEARNLLNKEGFKILRHEVSGISLVNFILDKVIFRTGKELRQKNKISEEVFNSIRYRFDKFFLVRLYSKFRPFLLKLGAQQLIIAKKE